MADHPIKPRQFEGSRPDGVVAFDICPVCGSDEILVAGGATPETKEMGFSRFAQIPVLTWGFCGGCGIARAVRFDGTRVWRVSRPID